MNLDKDNMSLSTFKKLLKSNKYYEIEECLDKLWNGNFSELEFDVNSMDFGNIEMSYQDANLLYTLCHGLFIHKDYKLCRETFELLHNMCFVDFNKYTDQELEVIYNNHGSHFEGYKPSREEIIKLLSSDYKRYFVKFENKLLCLFSNSNDPDIQEIFKLCSRSLDEEVRAVCCDNTNNLEMFENDLSSRIRKIIRLRTEIDGKINELSESEQKLIKYIIDMYNNKDFTISDGLASDKEDRICVLINGKAFDNTYFDEDRDVYWYMKDKRVVAYDIMKKIKDGVINFQEGMKPDFFENELAGFGK